MKARSGNVLMYVMIAILLFAALSFALMRSGGGDAGIAGGMGDERAALKGGELIAHAMAARSAVEQMRVLSNVQPSEFDFVKPGGTGFDTPPHTGKVFHPVGGGLSAFVDSPELFANGASGRGWVAQQGTNVEWSATGASDIIYTFVDTSRQICAAINQKLYKSSAIPVLSLTSSAAFVNGGADDAAITSASCTDCVGKPSLCVEDSAGAYAFYTIVLSR